MKVVAKIPGIHMLRALVIFEQSGLNAVLCAIDYRARTSLRWIDWIPRGEALGSISSGLREYLRWA